MILKDTNSMVRDDSSKAVVSTDIGALRELKSKRQMGRQLDSLQSRVESLETSLNTFNTLLKQLLDKNG